MTEDNQAPEVGQVLTLQQLVQARVNERGWSDGQLAARSERRLSRTRWQQLRTGYRMTGFPERESIELIAEVLEYDVTTVTLAIAKTIGLSVRRRGSDFAQLLPAGVDQLPPPVRDAILTVIRAVVADVVARGAGDDSDGLSNPDGVAETTLGWSKRDAPSGRNAIGHMRDAGQ